MSVERLASPQTLNAKCITQKYELPALIQQGLPANLT